jgi:citrate lyase subunit beta/citryl-CoA lyase
VLPVKLEWVTQSVLDWSTILLRSVLFAPGNEPRKVARVATFDADAIVLDLEDAVATTEKDAARLAVRVALPTFRGAVVMVRVNGMATGRCMDDLEAVVCPGLHAILVPKVEGPAELSEVDERLGRLEERDGLATGTIRLIPQFETALGIARVEEITRDAPARVYTLIFGLADFTVDLGIDLTADATEILYARSRVVVAARAAHLAAPIDGPYLLDLRDEAGLIRDSRRSRQLGFGGRVVIYPPQVAPVNRVFSDVSPEELAMARRIVAAFDEAEAAGSAAIQVDGRFVDYPIYRRAQHKLRLHAATKTSDECGTFQ